MFATVIKSPLLQYTKKVSNCPDTEMGIFTMDDDTIYSLINNLVYIINPYSGKCSGPVKVKNGSRIAVDKTRKLIYTKLYSDDIYQYSFNGKLIRSWSAPYNVSDMNIDSFGNMYVTDVSSNYIRKFSSKGKFLLKWGGKGEYDGRFNGATSLAIDKNNYIYVADRGNHRIQKFDSLGNFITKWGHEYNYDNPDDAYGFKYITRIAVDRNSKVYVTEDRGESDWSFTEYYHDKIKVFYSNGDYIGSNKLRHITTPGMNGVGSRSLSIDSLGNIYAGTNDRGGEGAILKYDKNYHFLDSWGNYYIGKGELKNIEDIVFNKDNDMYVLDRSALNVTKFSKNGTFIRRWGQSGSKLGELG